MDCPYRTEAEQQAFFDTVHMRAEQALAAAEGVVRTYALAGRRIQLRFAGAQLVPHLTPALAHLRVADVGEVDAVVQIWDTESTGIPMIEPPCPRGNFTDRGDLWGFNSRRYRAAFHWIECSVNVFDRATATGVYWVQTARTIPYWVKASPLRTLFHWWLEMHGFQLLHAAAVGTDHGAILLTGKGGIGKSTTALTALAHGLFYLGDDYLVVGLTPEPTVYSLYNTAKLTAAQLAHLPVFAPCVAQAETMPDEKAVLFLSPSFAEHCKLSMPLRAIATPMIEPRDDSIVVPAASALLTRAAAFTTMAQLPYAGHHTYAFIERLASTVPSFVLKLGRDLSRIPATITAFLAAQPWQTAGAAPTLSPQPDGVARPLISVIIPTYNGAQFLAEAVNTVLAQHYPALEIIIVNDGSTDHTDAVVAQLPIDVRYFTQANAGASAARNRGIRDAAGDYIAFLDVDDLWPPQNLHRLLEHLLHDPELDVMHGYAQILRYAPHTGRYEYEGNPRESFPYYIGAALYHRRVFEHVGLFDTELEFAEDIDWFNRAHELGRKIARFEEVTLHVRRHDHNMTGGKSLLELNTLRVFKKALDRKRQREAAQGLQDGSI